MSQNPAIILILGSRKTGERLVVSHSSTADAPPINGDTSGRQHIQLVPHYSHKHRFFFHIFERPATLSQIERTVTTQMKTLGANNANVAGIVFVCNEKYLGPTPFPFQKNTRFLDFSGRTLFEKLIVVPSKPGLSLASHLGQLTTEGMRILEENEPSEILPRIFSMVSAGGSEQTQIREISRTAEMSARRNDQQAVILLAGYTRHGKSKTVNRLLGRELLVVGRDDWGSTTKDIRRVEVHSHGISPSTTVAFDDTPGFECTTHEEREPHASLMRVYKDRYFKEIYPNVILLVVEWNSINPGADSDKEPKDFTSIIGRTIHNLYLSDLVDDQRANVVVVVTKSLSHPDQFDDWETPEEKRAQWRIEADRRRKIITGLQRKIFARSPPWEILFIENGGGKDMSAKFPVLPDGQRSHQNIYDGIHSIVERQGPDGSRDLLGAQALQALTGAKGSGSLGKAQVLVSKEDIVVQ